MKRARQLPLALPQRGGRRKGAGRKPKGRRAGVSHKARPAFDKPAAVHVTLRVADHVWNLRSRRSFRAIERCFSDALGRFGLRVIQFSVMGNHLHLIVEVDSSAALSRGMQGLCVRVAKALNRLMRSSGPVFADHYHSRIVRTPTELVNVLAYVLGNHAHHFGSKAAADPFSSAALDPERRQRVVAHPRTWLFKVGWRRARTRPHWL
jgi:putative transposase